MKILLLGYGKEGQAMEKYLREHEGEAEIEIWETFSREEILQRDYSSYDIIFRSPSVPPLGLPQETSITRYFFDHCPCPIIGVTATKGKGTICSFIKALLDAQGEDVYLVGNIGVPAIEILDKLTPNSVVVYEMSSFQLWDLPVSPHIAVVGTVMPDHLNVHADYDDYVAAKANIAQFQTENDYCVYYEKNPESAKIAELSEGVKIPYPFEVPDEIMAAVTLPGAHNRENAMAAIAAVAAYKNISPGEYVTQNTEVIKAGLKDCKGLPHRLEFLRELNGVKYYDDNFSTGIASTKVAIDAFPDERIVIIIGGRDKTGNADLDEIWEVLQEPRISDIVFIGESGQELASRHAQDMRIFYEWTLEDAVERARGLAESYTGYSRTPIVLMSPAAASFDMFKDVYARGAEFQRIVKGLR